jgi:phage replication initiation protein
MSDEKMPSAWASTTHAENTSENAQTLLVDWVTCSFKSAFDLQNLFHFIGISQLENMEIIYGSRYGFAGYNVTYKLGTIEIMYDENEQRYLLNMSGQACREYELLSGHDFVHLFALLNLMYPTYTRLDIAIDIYNDLFNTNIFRRAVHNKQCVTKLKEWGNNTRGLIATGNEDITMDSFYLGGKSSRYFINVYDKKLERASKGLAVDVQTWTRFEIRFKSEYAQQMVENILRNSDEFGEEIYQFLNDKIVFLKLSSLEKDSNRSRLASDLKNHARWWRAFLKTSKKLHLTVYKPDLPLLSSKAWLLDKVSTSLALFNHYYGSQGFEDLLRDLIVVGNDKLSNKHLKRLEHQLLLDSEMEKGIRDLVWERNTLKPLENKIVDLSTKKAKEKYKYKILEVFWEQVGEQQKKSTEFADSVDSLIN